MPLACSAHDTRCFVIHKKSEILPGLEGFAVWLMSQLDNGDGQMGAPENNLQAERKRKKYMAKPEFESWLNVGSGDWTEGLL